MGAWSQLLFVCVVACESGIVVEGRDLIQRLVDAGAQAALGFRQPVHYGQALKVWQTWFWNLTCVDGASISDAAREAAGAVLQQVGSYRGYDSYRIRGDGGLVLRPAGFGW